MDNGAFILPDYTIITFQMALLGNKIDSHIFFGSLKKPEDLWDSLNKAVAKISLFQLDRPRFGG